MAKSAYKSTDTEVQTPAPIHNALMDKLMSKGYGATDAKFILTIAARAAADPKYKLEVPSSIQKYDVETARDVLKRLKEMGAYPNRTLSADARDEIEGMMLRGTGTPVATKTEGKAPPTMRPVPKYDHTYAVTLAGLDKYRVETNAEIPKADPFGAGLEDVVALAKVMIKTGGYTVYDSQGKALTGDALLEFKKEYKAAYDKAKRGDTFAIQIESG
jgi:hypothetical protein